MKNYFNAFQVQHKVCDHKVVGWWSNSQRLWHWGHQWRGSYSRSRLLICNVAVSHIFILSDYMLFGTNLCFLSIWPILPDFLALFVQLCRPGSGKGKYCFQIANSQFWRIKNSSILSSANSIEILCIFPLPFSDWSEVVLKVFEYVAQQHFSNISNAETMKQSHHKRIDLFAFLFVVEEDSRAMHQSIILASWKG